MLCQPQSPSMTLWDLMCRMTYSLCGLNLPVFILFWISSSILGIMKLGASITLSTKSRRPSAWLCFIICQDIIPIMPLWVITDNFLRKIELFNWLRALNWIRFFHFPNIIHRWSQVLCSMSKCAMWSILDAITPWISLMNTCPSLIVSKMVSSFCVTCVSVS